MQARPKMRAETACTVIGLSRLAREHLHARAARKSAIGMANVTTLV
jgi:hypothetical protein